MATNQGWYKDENTGQYVQEASVLVNAAPSVCYERWTRLDDFPRLLRHIQQVTPSGGQTWHWEANIAGQHVEWDATAAWVPNESVSWSSTSGLRNSGTVTFVPEGNATRVLVRMMYDPPYGPIGDMVAERGRNDRVHQDLVEDLINFKNSVESGMSGQQWRAA
ncbi:MAG: SRPBCC family protein [Armatimonadota bacterium]